MLESRVFDVAYLPRRKNLWIILSGPALPSHVIISVLSKGKIFYVGQWKDKSESNFSTSQSYPGAENAEQVKGKIPL